MTECIREIPYAPEHGWRGVGDLYLPAGGAKGQPAALVIHGGGWNAMDKHGLAGIAELVSECGYAAFNINYRLLDNAPWPACGDDCLKAARFVLEAGHPAMERIDRRRLLVIGASAGGHLAMMTGLRLDSDHVRGIVSIAGPSDLTRRFAFPGEESAAFARRFLGEHQETARDALLAEASPLEWVRPNAPPLLCVHSSNDELVPLEQSKWIVDAYRNAGAQAQLFLFDGPGRQHGIWIDGTDPGRLRAEPTGAVTAFLQDVAANAKN